MAIDMTTVKAITHNNKDVIKIEDSNGRTLWEKAPTVQLTRIAISGYTTRLEVNTAFVYGGTVRAYYSDNTNRVVTSYATFSGYDMSTSGTYTVVVSYTENGITETQSYSLVVGVLTTSTVNITVGASQDITTTQYFNRLVFPSISTIKSKVATKTGISSSYITINDIKLRKSSFYWMPSGSSSSGNLYQSPWGPFLMTTQSGTTPITQGDYRTTYSRFTFGSADTSIMSKLSSSATTSGYGRYNQSYGSTYTDFGTSGPEYSGATLCQSSGSSKPTYTLVVEYEYIA